MSQSGASEASGYQLPSYSAAGQKPSSRRVGLLLQASVAFAAVVVGVYGLHWAVTAMMFSGSDSQASAHALHRKGQGKASRWEGVDTVSNDVRLERRGASDAWAAGLRGDHVESITMDQFNAALRRRHLHEMAERKLRRESHKNHGGLHIGSSFDKDGQG